MRSNLSGWDYDRLPAEAEELYRLCDSRIASSLLDHGAAPFHRESTPYLVSTEFPWLGFPDPSLEGRVVMTIGGSGDLPLFFLSMGARRVVAVDISREACWFCELKRAVLRRLEWRAALKFLLADLTAARWFLTARGIPDTLGAEERTLLYGPARGDLSRSARDHWDRRIPQTRSGRSPFGGFRGLAGLCFLDQIPYLACEDSYASWREKSSLYPLLNLPLEHAAVGWKASFDVVYCSNVVEYWREEESTGGSPGTFPSRFEAFLGHCLDLVAPGGDLYFYLFCSPEGEDCASVRRETDLLRRRGWGEDAIEITYRSIPIAGSRFRNTLLRYSKPRRS